LPSTQLDVALHGGVASWAWGTASNYTKNLEQSHSVKRRPALLALRNYLLVLVVLALGSYAPAHHLAFPRALCTLIGVDGGTFQFGLCTQKLTYRVGEIANITVSFGNVGDEVIRGWVITDVRIIRGGESVFSDGSFCLLEGCIFLPHEIDSHTFSGWRADGPGDYSVVETLWVIKLCDAFPCSDSVPAAPLTIGLTVTVAGR